MIIIRLVDTLVTRLNAITINITLLIRIQECLHPNREYDIMYSKKFNTPQQHTINNMAQ